MNSIAVQVKKRFKSLLAVTTLLAKAGTSSPVSNSSGDIVAISDFGIPYS